jgi:hypothetical protein
MVMTVLYNLRRSAFGYLLAKFDDDFNVAAVYELTKARDSSGRIINRDYAWSCTCPAGPRPSCRHRKMLQIMASKADTENFYCYETQTWHQPITAEGFPAEPLEYAKAVGPEPNDIIAEIPLIEEPKATRAIAPTEPKPETFRRRV